MPQIQADSGQFSFKGSDLSEFSEHSVSTRQRTSLRGIRLGLLWAFPQIKEVLLAKLSYTFTSPGSFRFFFFFFLSEGNREQGELFEWFLDSFTKTVELRRGGVGQTFCARHRSGCEDMPKACGQRSLQTHRGATQRVVWSFTLWKMPLTAASAYSAS